MPNTYNELEKSVNNFEERKNGVNWYLTFKEPEGVCYIDNSKEEKNTQMLEEAIFENIEEDFNSNNIVKENVLKVSDEQNRYIEENMKNNKRNNYRKNNYYNKYYNSK